MKTGRRDFIKAVATAGAVAAIPIEAEALPGPAHEVIVSDAKTVVDTTSGKLRGAWRSGIFVFKGVPYGESTGGANRFMSPVPVKPWAGIRDALRYGFGRASSPA